ncbi:MAG: YraN family protein [Verrucomicrobiae bacterium]|nr:YraN family protein [Verrucomicrobiae bacterium]
MPPHLKSGKYGENAAKKFLKSKGLKFLTSNYNSGRGEIDLIFRDGDCLVFVEVKTRDTSSWTRPEKAVDFRKRKALSRAAWDYIRLLKNPRLKFRFDIVEVITRNQQVQEIRHIENAFNVKMIL